MRPDVIRVVNASELKTIVHSWHEKVFELFQNKTIPTNVPDILLVQLIRKTLGEKRSIEERYSYFMRVGSICDFIAENREYLVRRNLIIPGEGYDQISFEIYDIGSRAKLAKDGTISLEEFEKRSKEH